MNAKTRPWSKFSPRSAVVRAVSIAASLIAALSCGDSGPASPSSLESGQAAFAVQPSFAAMPPGGPTIVLSRARAVLTAPNGEQTSSEGRFNGDLASLNLTVQLHGQSAEFILDITAFDAQGAVAFTSRQRIILKVGSNNSTVSPVLVYDAPDAKVTSVKIQVQGPMTLPAGGGGTLNVTGTLPNGQSLSPLVGWVSRDPAVATVDANGNVKAGQSQGSTYIVATSATGLRDSVLITVHAPVDRVVVAPATAQIIRGQTRTLGAELRDATNKLIDDRKPVWTSSDASVATVSATGVVTGVKIGKATITATSEGKTGSTDVTVVSPLASIEATPTKVELASLKTTVPIALKLVPVTGGAVDGLVPNFTSSNPAIATVSSTGVVTSVANGTTKITIDLDGISTTVDVTVLQVTTAVTLSPKFAAVSSIGESVRFSFQAVDAGGSSIEAPVVTWRSSDPNVATVTSTGLVTGRSAGSATITATIDGKSDAVTFVVSPTAKFLVVLTNKAKINTGETATLTAKIADAGGSAISDANATFTTTTPSIASVSGNIVTGLADGIAHIVGTAGTFSGAVDIRVVGPPTGGGEGLVVTPPTAEKLPNGTQQFTVTSGGSGPFTWTVNGTPGGNATYGTINATGFYTAPATVPTPATFDVCAVQASPAAQGCSHVTINPVPSAGADIIVFNDINFVDYGGSANAPLFKNLVNFTGSGPRATQTGFLVYRGNGSQCGNDGQCSPTGWEAPLRTAITSIGYTVIDQNVTTTRLTTAIASNIKAIMLLVPTVPFSNEEINVLKQFASEGGRVIFVGEHFGYYGTNINPVENTFLQKMGAVLRNPGNAGTHPGNGVYACAGTATGSGIRAHQLSTGVTSVGFACSTEVELGPNDFAIFTYFDQGFDRILVAAAKIDLTPLPPSGSTVERARQTQAQRSSAGPVVQSPPYGPGVPGWKPPLK